MRSSAMNGSNGYNNHFNSNYLAVVEHKSDSQSNCRTPIAWHNRSVNLSKPLSLVQSPVHYQTNYRRPSAQRPSQRPSSPSATTTSSDDREEVPMVRHHMRRPNSRVTNSSALTVDRRQHMIPNKYSNQMVSAMFGEYTVPMHTFRNGTLRSTKSVPALAMAGDSCPVHGNGLLMHACHPVYPSIPTQTLNFRRFGSINDIRESRIPMQMHSNGLSFLAPIPENKQCGGLMPVYYSQSQSPLSMGHSTLQALPPPPNTIPMHLIQQKAHPMQTTRPMIYPAYAEPLPFRSHFKVSSPVPSQHTIKMNDNYGDISDDICCRGHLVVLWIILGVVTVGVISGIILAVTLN